MVERVGGLGGVGITGASLVSVAFLFSAETNFIAIHSFHVVGEEVLAAGHRLLKIPNVHLNDDEDIQRKAALLNLDKMFVQVQPQKLVGLKKEEKEKENRLNL